MHNVESEFNQIDKKVVESPELLGKECLTCYRVLAYKFYRNDSSYRDGRRDQCIECENQPKLSTAEHTARLEEANFNSAAVKKQRWDNQLDYMDDDARQGRWMHHSEFVTKLHKLADNLLIIDGRIVGDLAVYKVYDRPQPQLDGKNFEYLFFLPTGWMPEASLIEFNERAIPVRERKRGWRTPLLRLIKAKIVTEEAVEREFGRPTPGADIVWNREMFRHRNGKLPN